MATELLELVRDALRTAGFQLADAAPDGSPGLDVSEAGGRVVIAWSPSRGLDALADEQQRQSLGAMVRAAVTGLLTQLGLGVAELPADGGLVVSRAAGGGHPGEPGS